MFVVWISACWGVFYYYHSKLSWQLLACQQSIFDIIQWLLIRLYEHSAGRIFFEGSMQSLHLKTQKSLRLNFYCTARHWHTAAAHRRRENLSQASYSWRSHEEWWALFQVFNWESDTIRVFFTQREQNKKKVESAVRFSVPSALLSIPTYRHDTVWFWGGQLTANYLDIHLHRRPTCKKRFL